MSTGKILGGVLIGVGAVAAIPFTGGGSVLAGASLITSLTGATALAGIAGVAGGAAGKVISSKEKKEKEIEKKNQLEEVILQVEIETKKKINSILETQKERDLLMLVSVKIGVFVSKIDGIVDSRELEEINKLCLFINNNPTTPEFIKNEITKIMNSDITFNEIREDINLFLESKSNDYKIKTNDFFVKLIETIISADGHSHPKEIEFLNTWKKEFLNY